MKRSVALVVFLFGLVFLLPTAAIAQDATPIANVTTTEEGEVTANLSDGEESVLLKINGNTQVAPGDTIENAVVINGNINVAGTVEDTVLVVKGDAVVTGTINGTISVVRGTLTLEPGSTVKDVMLVDSELNRADGATVTGEIEDRGLDFSFGRGLAVFSLLWWIGMTIVALVAAGIFAWLGRKQLFGSVGTLKTDFVKSLITAIVLWILLPLGAALILFTLVGAPLALLVLLVILPALWLLGMIVVGTWLGSFIINPTTTGRAVGAALLGTLILSAVSLIPFIAVITTIAAIIGSGAFVYRAIANRNATDLPAVPGWQAA
ncbi:MAG: hypothetical protein R2848_04440 [Thermomicrobiales bacterium]